MQEASVLATRASIEDAIGETLVAGGKLSPAGLDRALSLRGAGNDHFLSLLTKLGLVSERDVAEALAQRLGIAIVAPADFPEAAPLEHSLGGNFLRHAKVLPLADGPNAVTLAMADPLDEVTIRAIELRTRKRVEPRIATLSDIEAAHERLYPVARPAGEAAQTSAAPSERAARCRAAQGSRQRGAGHSPRQPHHQPRRRVPVPRTSISSPSRTASRCATASTASLREQAAPPLRLKPAILSRIKIMARLNIAERRLPQDGRIRVAVHGREFDLRVATTPTLHGESVVMRILDRTSLVTRFHRARISCRKS